MKKNIISAIRLTVATIILFAVVYPICVWGIAQLAPNNGKGEIIEYADNIYYTNIGQSFTSDKYFQSRPSAVNYNAAGSGGSNKAPSNSEYLETVKARMDTFMLHNPSIQKNEIPVDLITASGSGLDPHISPKSAEIQIPRIAEASGLSEEKIEKIVKNNTSGKVLGVFGEDKVNVLMVNIEIAQAMDLI